MRAERHVGLHTKLTFADLFYWHLGNLISFSLIYTDVCWMFLELINM
jgi:hypothetical protein